MESLGGNAMRAALINQLRGWRRSRCNAWGDTAAAREREAAKCSNAVKSPGERLDTGEGLFERLLLLSGVLTTAYRMRQL